MKNTDVTLSDFNNHDVTTQILSKTDFVGTRKVRVTVDMIVTVATGYVDYELKVSDLKHDVLAFRRVHKLEDALIVYNDISTITM